MKKSFLIVIPAIVTGICLFGGIKTYSNTKYFIKNTRIGNVDVSGLTVDEAKKKLKSSFNSKTITIFSQGKNEKLKLNEVAEYNGSSSADSALKSQCQNIENIFPFQSGKKYNDNGIKIIENKLSSSINKMNFMKGKDVSKNAYVKYVNGNVQIIKEHYGNQYKPNRVMYYINEQIKKGNTLIRLSDRNLMINPDIKSNDAKIKALKKSMENINNHKIVLTGEKYSKDKKVVLDSSRYMKYVSSDRNGNLAVNQQWLKNYITSLNSNFGTVGKPVEFKGADGKRIKAKGGTFGKSVNLNAELNKLKQDILSGKDVTRKVCMKTSGNNTLGKTYILVNIKKQKLTGYKNGKKVLSSNVVTGRNDTPERRTHRGAYYIFFKQSPDVLKGPGYATPVHSFSAFSGGQGFHDADSWRSAYGGNIYQHNGSHGCVNMPRKNSDKLYHLFGLGTPVIVI